MESRARRAGGDESPSSASLCPACRQPIDPLRAGQVAILDGAFRYFCDAACKSSWLEATSRRPALDAMTADPPPVTLTPPIVSSGIRDIDLPHFPAVTAPEAEDSREEREEREDEEEIADEPEVPEPEESPATLRSSLLDVAAVEAAAEVDEVELPAPGLVFRRSALVAIPIVGVFAGVLAAVVSLAGESAALLRLPLALLAAGVALARIFLRERRGAWAIAAPLAAGSVIAIASALAHDAHADGHASFVGLAAAAALVVEILLTRARHDVESAWERTTEGLAVRARVVRGEATVDVDADAVKPGEQVVVEAGEVVAVDGIVTAGEAEIAPWLDSPNLVGRIEGDPVVAGATVVSGRLRVNATFTGAERAWFRLTRPNAMRIDVAAPLVAVFRRFVDRGAPAFALVVGGAVYADNGSWFDVAIAACGGGYALAAVAAASAAAIAHARGQVAAQRRGIVYKDARAFEAAARADIAVVCSRGTILLGEPEIVAIEAITKDGDIDRVLAVAAGAELSSTHPFASAVLREARARGVRPDNVRSALGHSGLGVTALSPSGDRVIVGSRSFLIQEKVSVAIADRRTSELEAEGRSVLLVAVGERLVGLLALQDGLRPGARAAIQRLHDAHIEPVLLSGEARDTCETIARALDLEHVRPEILPVDRGAEVRALADGGHVVAALGHASTDDGALGAADVSVAMESAGAAPGEWGVALASDDVRDAALALTLPRGARDRARTAIIVGGLTQALGAVGVAFGVAPAAIVPVLGVLAAAAVVTIVREPVT